MARQQVQKIPTADLRVEFRRRAARIGQRVKTLQRRRATTLQRIAAIDAEIDELYAVAGKMRLGIRRPIRKRPRNKAKLADALLALLTGKTLSVTDAAEEVQKAGYQTTSPNFRTIVNQTLIKDKRIKRVGRGQYTAK